MTNVAPDNVHSEQKVRSECAIQRTHQRFLLRTLQFSQQYAPMYRNRLESQHAHALHAIVHAITQDRSLSETAPINMPSSSLPYPQLLRVLELSPGTPSLCVGVVYKNMRLLPKFLDLYQRELVRVDAGGEDGDGDGGDAMSAELPLSDTVPPLSIASAVSAANKSGVDGGGGDESWVLASMDEHYTVSDANDELTLEDSSGRIVLAGLDSARFCTGVVLGVYGTLLKNGVLHVMRYALCGLDAIRVTRCRLTHTTRWTAGNGARTAAAAAVSMSASREPCYIAFVCGLSISGGGCVGNDSITSSSSSFSAEERATRQRAHTMLNLLLDFVCGDLGDEVMQEQARRISRLVIGGNSIARTEELQLKKKVRLDHTDYTRLNEDKTSITSNSKGGPSSVDMMRAFDMVLARLCASVEVELMPGDMDMSDAFFPQQPLHPVLLPRSSRYSTLRLVTNPYSFTAMADDESVYSHSNDTNSNNNSVKKDEDMEFIQKDKPKTGNIDTNGRQAGVHFFVTSGQNVNDLARETRFDSRLDAMQMMLQSGCACPTAPNTLFSYPFHKSDPFLFTTAPHCFVACDQPRFETCFITPAQLNKNTSCYYDTAAAAGARKDTHGSASGSKAHAKDAVAKDIGSEAAESNKALTDSATGGQGGTHNNDDNEEEVNADSAGDVKDDLYSGTRIISVPSFDRTGILVLVDVHSPSLQTTMIDFSIK